VVPKISRQLFSHRLRVALVHEGLVVGENEFLVLLGSHPVSPLRSRSYDAQAFGQSLLALRVVSSAMAVLPRYG
jgi:hypothetical protein